MKKIIMCLHQVYRPSANINSFPHDGRGNCNTCQTDAKNKDCVGYMPISTIRIFVEEKKDALVQKEKVSAK